MIRLSFWTDRKHAMKRSMHKIFKAKLQQVLLILLCFAVLPLSHYCETSVLGNDAYQKIPENLEVTLSTDKTEYQFGDDVKMMLTVRNVGDKPVVLNFGNGQIYDFAIRKLPEENEVWRWSSCREFTQAAWSVILATEEKMTYSEVWNQLGEALSQVKPGLYRIEANQLSEPELSAKPVHIRILEQQFETIDKGAFSGYTERCSFVITDKQKWSQVWNIHTRGMVPRPPLPEVDFLYHVVVAVFRGEFPTVGYSTEVKQVRVLKDRIMVAVVEADPDGIAITTHTQPYHIAKLKKKALPVEFVFNQ
jgi:hypothetical protein